MSMLKFFRVPFALSGTRTPIPDTADPSGFVSYIEGYGADYQRAKADPLSKNIERDKMNELFFDATNAIAELQSQGVPDFITTALNGGSPYSYGRNAVVRWTDGEIYMSLAAANTTTPADPTEWALVGIGLTIVKGDGVTDNTAAVQAANTRGRPILFIGVSVIGSATTLTVPIVDTLSQIFSSGSLITIDNDLPVRPEWWGNGVGTLLKAITALPATGGEIRLEMRDYNIVGQWALSTTPGASTGNLKPNVKINCAGAPTYDNKVTPTRFVSGSGTVIQGSFINFADGLQFKGGFGVDVGSYVVDTLNAGTYLEGFIPGTHNLNTVNTDLTTYIRGVNIDGLARVLVKTPVSGTATTYKHGFLFEHTLGGFHGDVEVHGGYHGYVNKSLNSRGGNVWVHDQQFGDSYILKSDQYTLCGGLVLDSLTIGKDDSILVPPAGRIESSAASFTEHIAIGILRGIKCGTLMAGVGGAFPKNNISLGVVLGDQITGAGLLFDANFKRVTVGQHTFTNTSDAGIWTLTGASQISLGDGSVTNSANDGYRLGGDVQHGKINAVNCTGWGVNRSTETVLDVNAVSGSGNTTGLISSYYTALTNADLVNSWVNNSGTDWPFQAVLIGRTMHIRGVIKSGTAGLVSTLPVGLRPVLNIPTICLGVTAGGVRGFAHITVGSNGQIVIDNFAGAAPGLGGTGAVVAFNFSFLL